MGLEGSVRGAVDPRSDRDQVEVFIDSPAARHLVGRRGVTLRAIRLLLEAAMADEFGNTSFELSIEGGDRRRDEDDRGRSRERMDDRGPRRDDRRDDRGPRRDDRGPRRDDRRDDRGPRRDDRGPRNDDRRSDRDIDKLRSLARRLAEEAMSTGEPVRFRKEMNSYERRVVHMELSDMTGVRTESEGDGSLKFMVIIPVEPGGREE